MGSDQLRTETAERLARYVREYSEQAWPTYPAPEPTDEDLDVIEGRSDGWANAHVEGEHEAFKTCPYTSPAECGERMAASEFVECN